MGIYDGNGTYGTLISKAGSQRPDNLLQTPLSDGVIPNINNTDLSSVNWLQNGGYNNSFKPFAHITFYPTMYDNSSIPIIYTEIDNTHTNKLQSSASLDNTTIYASVGYRTHPSLININPKRIKIVSSDSENGPWGPWVQRSAVYEIPYGESSNGERAITIDDTMSGTSTQPMIYIPITFDPNEVFQE